MFRFTVQTILLIYSSDEYEASAPQDDYAWDSENETHYDQEEYGNVAGDFDNDDGDEEPATKVPEGGDAFDEREYHDDGEQYGEPENYEDEEFDDLDGDGDEEYDEDE